MFWSLAYHGRNMVDHLNQVFHRIKFANLKLNVAKCQFANASLDFLGHTLSLSMIQPRQQKVDALLKFPPPKTTKQVKSFLGLAGYYRRFLPHCSDLTYPITALLKKNTPFRWTEASDNAFTDLKSRLASRAILKPPRLYKKVFDRNRCLKYLSRSGSFSDNR